MGVLNFTPDSFSDGGAYSDVGAAVAAGRQMAADGADIIDVGGESTRPGAAAIDPSIEQERIIPIIRALASYGTPISVDTRNAATMLAALRVGASIVNDVSGLNHDPASASIVASNRCAVVLMHMRGSPVTMGKHASYRVVVEEVAAELSACVAAAEKAGIQRHSIALDPGVGFAKDAGQSAVLLGGLARLADLGYPLMVGVSRKSFIGALARERDSHQRLAGSLAAALFALSQGAAILRVHDVRETVQAVRVWTALSSCAEDHAARRDGANLCAETPSRGLVREAPGP